MSGINITRYIVHTFHTFSKIITFFIDLKNYSKVIPVYQYMWNFVCTCISATLCVIFNCCLQFLSPTDLDKLGSVSDPRVNAWLNDRRFHSQHTAAGWRAFKGRHLVSPHTNYFCYKKLTTLDSCYSSILLLMLKC